MSGTIRSARPTSKSSVKVLHVRNHRPPMPEEWPDMVTQH